jgi:hypothetical protein
MPNYTWLLSHSISRMRWSNSKLYRYRIYTYCFTSTRLFQKGSFLRQLLVYFNSLKKGRFRD